MHEGGDTAYFWRISEDRFAMEWSCGNQYFFRFDTIERLLDALPARGKVGVTCIRLVDVDQDGSLGDFYAYKRDGRLIVIDDGCDEAVSVRIPTLRNTIARVKAGPILDTDPDF